MMEGDEEDEEDFKDDDDDDDALNDESHLLPGEQTDILAHHLDNPPNLQCRLDRTGVCYLSRIPPFMKPQALRHLLSQHGTIGRIYLAPEDPKVTARRKKYKGNRRVNFVEGWVEFEDKKLGRRAAEFLNGRNVGGKKTGRFYDDLWSIRYLPRFKWHHLTDQIAYERAVRDQKLRAEMSAVKRENKGYLRNVAKNKMIQAIEARKAKQLLEKDTGRRFRSLIRTTGRECGRWGG
ncbi:hypothetical protein BC829DRAFT_368163 [Chytridium lagenaria]|nr:hypothetical protein BC829DRAFT_368163 [Chytridium lagenaria]